MNSVSEEWLRLSQANVDAAVRCVSLLLEGAGRLLELQARLAPAMIADSTKMMAFWNIGQPPQQAMSDWPVLYAANLGRVIAINRGALDLGAQMQGEISKLVLDAFAATGEMAMQTAKTMGGTLLESWSRPAAAKER